MSVVIISSDMKEKRKEIAEKVAQILGYTCVGEDLLADVAKKYQIPLNELEWATKSEPGFFDLNTNLRTRYLSYIQADFINRLKKDNVVCHGGVGPFFIAGVSHVLKVNLLVNTADYVRMISQDENISEAKALKIVLTEIKSRKKWVKQMLDIDMGDPILCDLSINVSQIGVDKAVDIITDTVKDSAFKPMTYSIKCLADIAQASAVKVALIQDFPDVQVQAKDGDIFIQSKIVNKQKGKNMAAIKEQLATIEGINHIDLTETLL